MSSILNRFTKLLQHISLKEGCANLMFAQNSSNPFGYIIYTDSRIILYIDEKEYVLTRVENHQISEKEIARELGKKDSALFKSYMRLCKRFRIKGPLPRVYRHDKTNFVHSFVCGYSSKKYKHIIKKIMSVLIRCFPDKRKEWDHVGFCLASGKFSKVTMAFFMVEGNIYISLGLSDSLYPQECDYFASSFGFYHKMPKETRDLDGWHPKLNGISFYVRMADGCWFWADGFEQRLFYQYLCDYDYFSHMEKWKPPF